MKTNNNMISCSTCVPSGQEGGGRKRRGGIQKTILFEGMKQPGNTEVVTTPLPTPQKEKSSYGAHFVSKDTDFTLQAIGYFREPFEIFNPQILGGLSSFRH